MQILFCLFWNSWSFYVIYLFISMLFIYLFRVKFRMSHDWVNFEISFGGWVINLLLNHTTSGCVVCYSEARVCQGSHCMAHSILSVHWAFLSIRWTHSSHHGFQMFISVYEEILASRRTRVTLFRTIFHVFHFIKFRCVKFGKGFICHHLATNMIFLMSIFGNVWQSL